MDKIARANAADRLLKDETFISAVASIKADMTRELLIAATPEDRESKWQEHHGLIRVERRLTSWAADVRHKKQDNTK